MIESANMQEVAGTRVRGRGVWEHFTVLDGLPDMKVECLFEDSDGGIWVGTHDGGAARFDGERFVCYSTEDGLSSDSIYSVTEDKIGNLWFATNRGLTRYDGTTFEIIDVSLDYSFLWGSCMDEAGDLWFGLDRRPGRPAGVVRLDGNDLELIEAEESEGISGNSVKSVAYSADKGIYLCANDLYHISSSRLSKLRWPIEEGAHHHFNRLGFGSTGVLTVLTSTGAFTWEGSDLKQISKTDMPGYASFAVHSGSHFLGSHAGRLERISNEENGNELQISKSIQSLLTDSAGNLWLGTFGAGLARTEPGVWRLFEGEGPEWSPLSITRQRGTDGVWVGSTHGLGTATKSGWDNTQVQYRYAITAVCLDDGGGVWMGERNGAVSLVKDGKESRRFTSAEVRGFRVSSIEHGDGDIWYSCSPGLGLRRIRAQSDPPNRRGRRWRTSLGGSSLLFSNTWSSDRHKLGRS